MVIGTRPREASLVFSMQGRSVNKRGHLNLLIGVFEQFKASSDENDHDNWDDRSDNDELEFHDNKTANTDSEANFGTINGRMEAKAKGKAMKANKECNMKMPVAPQCVMGKIQDTDTAFIGAQEQ